MVDACGDFSRVNLFKSRGGGDSVWQNGYWSFFQLWLVM